MTATNGVRLRAGDHEREEIAEQLRDAHVDGRLTVDELLHRLDRAYGAAHLDELAPLVADLPRPQPPVADPRTRRPRGWAGPPAALVLLVVVLSIALLASGHPPFPLLWLGIAWLVWHRASFHHRAARARL